LAGNYTVFPHNSVPEQRSAGNYTVFPHNSAPRRAHSACCLPQIGLAILGEALFDLAAYSRFCSLFATFQPTRDIPIRTLFTS
ncbi:hypothetical protein, partial [Cohnella sp. OV330]|uniref:hypothetical protein n=1 Tax=Cohnella sp. OV330 TaxID=1855288 RepID=UPI001C42F978